MLLLSINNCLKDLVDVLNQIPNSEYSINVLRWVTLLLENIQGILLQCFNVFKIIMIQVLWIMINEKEMYCSKWYWFRDESGRNYLELFGKKKIRKSNCNKLLTVKKFALKVITWESCFIIWALYPSPSLDKVAVLQNPTILLSENFEWPIQQLNTENNVHSKFCKISW
jgi:hypothetical protein